MSSSFIKIEEIPELFGICDVRGSVYFIDSKESGLIMIDSGLFFFKRKIKKILRYNGFKIDDIEHVLITHADGDHIGTLNFIRNQSPAKIYTSKKTEEYILNKHNPRHSPKMLHFLQQFFTFFTIKKVKIDFVFKDGDILDLANGIRVLSSPGHTDDHHSFWWKNKKVLFSGDIFTYINKISTPPIFLNFDNNLFKSSLKKLIELNPKYICAGHSKNFYKVYDRGSLLYLLDK